MPSVPVARNTVGIAEMTNAKLQPADFGAAGEMVGRSVAQLGQQGSQLAQDQFEHDRQVQELHDDAAARQAATQARGAFLSGYDTPDSYFNTGGKDALLAQPTFVKSLDDTITASRSTLQNPRQQRMFDQMVTPQRQEWGFQINQHANKSTEAYNQAETQSDITMSGELAKHVYFNDPVHGERQIATGLEQIDKLGAMQHMGPDAIALEKLKFTSGTYRDIGQSLVYADPVNGPKLAAAFAEKHADSMTDDDRRLVTNNARTYQNSLDAAQRREEAEARRENHAQITEARARAESVSRSIEDGVNIDSKTLASAMNDAQFAKDPALVERIRQGGMKNALTQEYINTPPAELQNTVNELSAEITKKGGNVDPDLVVKRDHLQKVLAKSSADLKADPLSWGAQHLGINPGSLDLKDPSSIQARTSAALAVSHRTGAPPVPITNEEAASFAPIVTDGSVKQKTDLVQHLAAFGSLAKSAVEKIALGDAGFQSLVGLAQLTNPAAARNAVTRVITGREVLKTNPQMIDEKAATQQFQEIVGPALTFLPTATKGAFDNSKAILASEAGANGKHTWGDVQDRWGVAINAALGGYTVNGVKVGGLGKINGAVTVLPEGMSQDDFDKTIARATGPMFVNASGRQTPVYSDGSIPTATTIKKMIWVPVADGRYRITDGHGFLQKRGGGFYEVDLRNLH